MNIKSDISRQLQSLRNVFFYLQIPAGLIMLLVLFLKLRFDIDTGNLTRDVNALAELPLYTGLVSNLGILFWCASAAITLFTGWPEKNKGIISVESFLIYSGFLSLLLMLDDLLQLHEVFFPEELHIPEMLAFAIYAIFAITIFVRHRKIILTTNYLILLTCLLFFGISLTVDIFFSEMPGENLLEDGAKFVGILTWFGYYASLSHETVKKKLSAL